MDNFLTNQWIVGTGVTVIGGLILYGVFGIGRSPAGNIRAVDDAHTGGDIIGEKKISVSNRIHTEKSIEGLNPDEIFGYLKHLPPRQRNIASKSYRGIRVSWNVEFKDAIPQRSGLLYLITSYPTKNFIWIGISGEVRGASYPKLNIINEDHEIRIKGVIDDIHTNNMSIRLRNCTLDL